MTAKDATVIERINLPGGEWIVRVFDAAAPPGMRALIGTNEDPSIITGFTLLDQWRTIVTAVHAWLRTLDDVGPCLLEVFHTVQSMLRSFYGSLKQPIRWSASSLASSRSQSTGSQRKYDESKHHNKDPS